MSFFAHCCTAAQQRSSDILQITLMLSMHACMQDCAVSRVDAGTHFPFAVDQSVQECPKIGTTVYEWLERQIAGTEPPRPCLLYTSPSPRD